LTRGGKPEVMPENIGNENREYKKGSFEQPTKEKGMERGDKSEKGSMDRGQGGVGSTGVGRDRGTESQGQTRDLDRDRSQQDL